MNKKPVIIIIAALSAIGVIIAVGIFTKLRMSQEAAINGNVPASAGSTYLETTAAPTGEGSDGDPQTASAAAAAAAAARAAQEAAMEAADGGHTGHDAEAPAAH